MNVLRVLALAACAGWLLLGCGFDGDSAGEPPASSGPGTSADVESGTTTDEDATGGATGTGDDPQDTSGGQSSRTSDGPGEVCSPPGSARCAGRDIARCDADGVEQRESCEGLACVDDGDGPRCACLGDLDCPADHFCDDEVCEPQRCTPGEASCGEDGHVWRCDDRGREEILDEECDILGCEDGACLAPTCEPGARLCEDGVAIRCSDDGTTEVRETCAPLECDGGHCVCGSDTQCGDGALCEDGTCEPVSCTPGEEICREGDRRRCAADGSAYAPVESCPAGCADDGTPRCSCSGDADCGTADFCDAGACAPRVCEPGAARCHDGAVQRCDERGSGWDVEETCAGRCVLRPDPMCICDDAGDCPDGFFCEAEGTCAAEVCAPGEATCEGSVAVACNADGSQRTEQDCAPRSCVDGGCACTEDAQCGEDRYCDAEGVCRLQVCTPNAVFCSGPAIRTCDERGTGSRTDGFCPTRCVVIAGAAACGCTTSLDCEADEFCDTASNPAEGGVCAPQVCEPGSRQCEGTVALRCDALGSDLDVEECAPGVCEAGACGCLTDDGCDEGFFCAPDGACVAQLCEPDTLACEGDTIARCNARGTARVPEVTCQAACEEATCVCDADAECNAGWRCDERSCTCPSDTICGSEEACCPDGTECELVTFCDEDGLCIEDARCLPPCDGGEQCGSFGELCCTEDTPICGVAGTCVRDCGADRVLCGADDDVCCDAGDLCIFDECRSPGTACADFRDCDFGQYCEPAIGRCLSSAVPDGLTCQQPWDFEIFNPALVWHWQGVTHEGTFYRNVMSTPMVADMNGDGTPNVVFQAYASLGDTVIVVLDGATGETIHVNGRHTLHGAGQVALGDITGNGLPEILTVMRNGVGVIRDIVGCPDYREDDDGCYLWRRNDGTFNRNFDGGAALLADLNGDGNVEVVLGSYVLDGRTGSTLVQGRTDSAGLGGLSHQWISIVADVTGDGLPEILTGDCAFRPDFEEGELVEVWCNSTFSHGLAAVGDVVGGDRAGLPEVVVARSGRLRILAGDTGTLLHDFDLPGSGHGGPPNIADFYGDGTAEIGVATADCFTVFDLACLYPEGVDEPVDQPGCIRPQFPDCTLGEDCFIADGITPVCETLPGGTGDGILWSVFTQDVSSSTTGASVFDFQGDGRNEALYNDECRFMAYDGATGQILFSFPNTNRTNSEYPVIVDVTGDGFTEIVYSANNDMFSRDCAGPIDDYPDLFPECHPADPDDRPDFCDEGTAGVFAWGDPTRTWVRTRQIWNQHQYFIDNVRDDGSIPHGTADFWRTHNTYRANRQGDIPLNSPDPRAVSLTASSIACPPELTLNALVANDGTSGIAPGMPVTFFRVEEGVATPLGTVLTDEPLLPGQRTRVAFTWTVPADLFDASLHFRVRVNVDATGQESVLDCRPDNTTAEVENVRCTSGGQTIGN